MTNEAKKWLIKNARSISERLWGKRDFLIKKDKYPSELEEEVADFLILQPEVEICSILPEGIKVVCK